MTARAHSSYDTRSSRTAGIVIAILLHVAAGAALMQVDAVRNAVDDIGPLFVSFVAPEPPKVEIPPVPPPPPRPAPKKQAPPLVVSEAPPAPREEFVVPEPPHEPAPVAPVIEEVPAPPAPVVAPPAPKVITAVEFIRPPKVEYPALSRRLGERGRVVLRVLINRDGLAERVEVQTGSSSARLDEAAIKAAREALYRPYRENGEAIPVWALLPIVFELH
jgi:protein TonB